MKKAVLILLMLAASLSSAQPVQEDVVQELKPRLNSDRITYFFGSYGVEALDIETSTFPKSRIANLFSLRDGQRVMRTLAVVDFKDPVHSELANVHETIVAGKSIGIALRDEGWTIQKVPVYFGVIELSQSVMQWMEEATVGMGAIHIYRLDVTKGERAIPYCTIVEIHSPEYLSPEWLQALYPEQYDNFSVCTLETSSLLFRLSKLMAKFPAP